MGTWWQQIGEALREDFSDLPDVGHATQVVVRLLVAALLGGVLGYEREQAGKSAGLRTHMLVALGSALFILVPQQSGVTPADLTRVLQGLIAGIGFLGAGSILKRSDEGDIKGLTTAASIWLTAAIGVAAGMGRETSAILSTVLALLILSALPRFADWISAGISRSRHEQRTEKEKRHERQ
jgi:putative Mg2+ transporter-C (MgtC) family protein